MGSVFRSALKTAIFNSLHLWGILPSAEQQATMTPAAYQKFVASAVARVSLNKGYLSTGFDSNVSCLEFLEFLMLIYLSG